MPDYEKYIQQGKDYEKNFMEFLDNHGLAFIHIDQDTKNDHYSIILEGSKTKRPDFFIYLPTIGHVFIDVKSRYTIENISNADVSEFYLPEDEIDSLFSFQSYFLLPVWLAFVSTKKSDNRDFFLVPITILKVYKDGLRKELGRDNNILDYLFIRIPNSYLKNILDDINHISINNIYDINNITEEAEEYGKINKKIIEIVDDLDNNKIKSKEGIINYCIKNNFDFIKVCEIERYMKLRSSNKEG